MANTSTWTSRLGRLKFMDGRELFDRFRQASTARVDLLRYWSGHDFRSPRFEAAESPGRFFFQPAAVPSLCALLKQVFPSQADHIVFQAGKICRHQFDVL